MSISRRLGAALRLSSVVVVILALVATVAVATGQAGSMRLLVARAGHTATAQLDGSLVIAGGTGNRGVIKSLEFFDPVSGKSTPGPRLLEARSGHSAIALADGRVLLTGGRNGDNAMLASSEVYDAAGSTLNPGASMGHARANHTSTLLADGRVLIAGGDAEGMAEIYDPATDRFVDTGRVAVARSGHSAVRLGDGRVLLVGGYDAAGATAEIFDPKTNIFSAVRGGLKTARVQPALKLISDGKVQVYGGDAEITMEVYNPDGYFSSRGHLLRDSSAFRSIMYSPGQAALIAIPSAKGKHYAEDALGPEASEFERTGYTATEVAARSTMVVVGGFGATGAALDTITELGSCGGTVTTDLTDYSPGQTVVMSGSGWTPGEQITLNLHRDTNDPPDTTLYATADQDGNWIISDYVVQEFDLGVTFVLTATGDSGCTAQTTFTDAAADILHVRASSGVTTNLTYLKNPSGNCLNGSGTTTTIALTSSAGLDDSSFGNSDKYRLTVPAVLSSPDIPVGAVFDHWDTPSGPDTSNPICINGSNGGKIDTYTAVFSQACTAPTVSTVNNVTITYGADATFSATLTGSGSITTQWQVDTGSGFSDIVGSAQTSSSLTRTLTLTRPRFANPANHYQLRVVNPCGGADIFSNSALLTVNKAQLTVTANNKSKTYGDPIPTLDATITGFVPPDTLATAVTGTANCTTTATASSAVGSYPITCTQGGLAASNYTFTFVAGTLTISQATPTVVASGGTFPYDGNGHTGMCTVTGVGGADLGMLTPTYTPAGTPTNAGTYTVNCDYPVSTNYTAKSATATLTITQATPTVMASGGTFPYDGNGHTGMCTVTGVGGADLGMLTPTYTPAGTPTNAGTYTVNCDYPVSTNYTAKSATATLTITQATPTVMASGGTFPYDGNGHTGMCTVTGVGGADLGMLTPTYTPAGTPTNAGTYTVNCDYPVSTNYTAKSATATLTITQATPTVMASGGTFPYDGNGHTGMCTVTGVGGADLGMLTPTYTPAGTPTNAGTYTVNCDYPVSTNYTAKSATATLTITQATPTVMASGGTFPYDGNGHTGMCTVTGVGGADLGMLTPTYTPAGTPTNAGTYTVNCDYPVSTNYTAKSATASLTISQATSTTTVSCPLSVTYTGLPQQTVCTASFSTSDGHSGTLTLTYSNNTNVGTATASAMYAGDANHFGSSNSASFAITPADALISVQGYGVTYNGASHAATGSAMGVLGESLAGLDLGGTVHTAAGSYTDTWTFTDVTGNYNNATGTVNDVIGKADATIVVTPYDVPFDAMPHTATGTAKGVLGETLAGLNLSGTTHSAAGTYNDTWTFTDVTGNYKNTSGQVTDVIEACMAATSISSNFNGTSIAAGRYIWFNSNFSVSGAHTTPVAISFTDQTITSGYFSTPVPDSVVILDPAATTATTTFAGGMWITRVPASGLAGNTLLSGAPYLVPTGGLRGGINPVTWSGVISTGTPGIKLNWAWGAAVYTSFSGDPGQVGVKPVDDNKASAYKNSDHAGTPESFKAFVTGGARGGGGSNFTGSWSGTDGVTPVCTQ